MNPKSEIDPKFKIQNSKLQFIESYDDYFSSFDKLLYLYKDWNSKINISSIKDDKEIIIKHFLDSLYWNEVSDFSWKKVLDIWTWWWFPLLPLAITNPTASFIWLDSVNKKLEVIKHIADDIWLTNVKVVHARSEQLAHDKKYREQFDIVTARAFSKWSSMLEMTLPFVKVWWELLAYQTLSIIEEIEQKKWVLEKLWGSIQKINKFILPEWYWERVIVVIKKNKRIPDIYPREVWMPKKDPL